MHVIAGQWVHLVPTQLGILLLAHTVALEAEFLGESPTFPALFLSITISYWPFRRHFELIRGTIQKLRLTTSLFSPGGKLFSLEGEVTDPNPPQNEPHLQKQGLDEPLSAFADMWTMSEKDFCPGFHSFCPAESR